jgi:hypothetical protein
MTVLAIQTGFSRPCDAGDAQGAVHAADGPRHGYVLVRHLHDDDDDDDGHARHVHAYGYDDPHHDEHTLDPMHLPGLEVLDCFVT